MSPAALGPAEERSRALDAMRGVALAGVLLVNLLTVFRVSLFEHILTFHTHPGAWNRLADVLAAAVVEFKAFALFSLLFGIGVAWQARRASERGANAKAYLLRRFGVLLAIGAIHLLLIWNGDILGLYAVCGLLLIPALRLPAAGLAWLGGAVIVMPYVIPFGIPLPEPEALRIQATEATRVYASGGFWQIMEFRWQETGRYILPLLAAVMPRTMGLMLWGLAVGRSGILQQPERLRWVLIVAGATGAVTTTLHVYAASSGRRLAVDTYLVDLLTAVPLALAYGAGLWLWFQRKATGSWIEWPAAAGRMALTNYLAQSIVLSFLFYGFGLAWFGRMGPAAGTLLALALCAAQASASLWWLRRFRFGPAEWLWRSLTYGRRVSFRRL